MPKSGASNILYPIPPQLEKLIVAIGDGNDPPMASVQAVLDFYYSAYSDIINSFYETTIAESRSVFRSAWSPELELWSRAWMHWENVTENDLANEIYTEMGLLASQIMTMPYYQGQTQATVDTKFSSLFSEVYLEKFSRMRAINRTVLSTGAGWYLPFFRRYVIFLAWYSATGAVVSNLAFMVSNVLRFLDEVLLGAGHGNWAATMRALDGTLDMGIQGIKALGRFGLKIIPTIFRVIVKWFPMGRVRDYETGKTYQIGIRKTTWRNWVELKQSIDVLMAWWRTTSLSLTNMQTEVMKGFEQYAVMEGEANYYGKWAVGEAGAEIRTVWGAVRTSLGAARTGLKGLGTSAGAALASAATVAGPALALATIALIAMSAGAGVAYILFVRYPRLKEAQHADELLAMQRRANDVPAELRELIDRYVADLVRVTEPVVQSLIDIMEQIDRNLDGYAAAPTEDTTARSWMFDEVARLLLALDTEAALIPQIVGTDTYSDMPAEIIRDMMTSLVEDTKGRARSVTTEVAQVGGGLRLKAATNDVLVTEEEVNKNLSPFRLIEIFKSTFESLAGNMSADEIASLTNDEMLAMHRQAEAANKAELDEYVGEVVGEIVAGSLMAINPPMDIDEGSNAFEGDAFKALELVKEALDKGSPSTLILDEALSLLNTLIPVVDQEVAEILNEVLQNAIEIRAMITLAEEGKVPLERSEELPSIGMGFTDVGVAPQPDFTGQPTGEVSDEG